jgi:hypothetical protein
MTRPEGIAKGNRKSRFGSLRRCHGVSWAQATLVLEDDVAAKCVSEWTGLRQMSMRETYRAWIMPGM